MFLDHVVRTSSPRRIRALLAVGVVAAMVATSVPAESATKKKSATAASPKAASKKAASPKAVRAAPFSLPSSVGLVDDVTGGAAVVRQGSVASLASSTVSVGGTRTVSIGALADEALTESRADHGRVVSARSALFADPTLTEEVKETADATILTSRSSFTVVDRAAVGASVPSLGAFRSKSVSLNSLTASQRDAFDRYKRTLDTKPNGHPLKDAAARGDAALFDALKQGQADITMTTTVRVEKNPTPASGRFERIATPPVLLTTQAGETIIADLNGAQGAATGETNRTSKFLTGWSKGDALHWSHRIDLGVAWVEIGAHAGYTIGLRVPVEMKGAMTPSAIQRNGSGNFNDSYEVRIYDVAAVDGDVAHYQGTGLENDLVDQGREFALQADLYVFAKGEVLGANFNKRFPERPLLDEGMNMRPPYGDCGVACGLNFFFPTSLTKTGINVLGIVSGGGQLGFNVGGSGLVSYDYESLVSGAVVSSTRVSSGATARTHRVSTDGRTGTSNRFITTLPERSMAQIPFGYRLSNPGYDWNIAVTPVVKASGEFDYLVGKYDFTLGPYALPMSIELGTLKLSRHDGTQEKAEKVDGVVTTDQSAAGNRPNLTNSSMVAGSAQIATTTPTTRPGRKGRKKAGGPAAVSPPLASVVGPTPAVAVPAGNKNTRKKGGQANNSSKKKKKKAAA